MGWQYWVRRQDMTLLNVGQKSLFMYIPVAHPARGERCKWFRFGMFVRLLPLRVQSVLQVV